MSGISEQVTNRGLGILVAGSAATTRLWYESLPEWLSIIATVVGIALSCVLIYTHLKKYRAELKVKRLECKRIQADLNGIKEGSR